MTDHYTPLLNSDLVIHSHGRPAAIPQRILLMLIGLCTMAVAGIQYYSAVRNANVIPSPTPLLTFDDFLSDSVVEYRNSVPEKDDDDGKEEENDIENKKESTDVGLELNGTPLHVVFSTSCSDQMHWESYVFFYHAWKVRQPGTVTRIASGCNDEEAEAAKKFHKESIQTMSDRFHLHLTPDFSKFQRMDGKKANYKYMNKPFGLRDWLESELGMDQDNRQEGVEDGVVILMDPDMVLLRPIVHDYTNEDVIFVEDQPALKMVKHGHPMAQQDGYLDNKWMHINGTFVTQDPGLGKPKDKDGPLHWNTGPPYLATVRDMYDISVLWTDYAPRVDHINPGLFAEMQGFIWATYKLDLPHTLIKSLVVSNTQSPHREGWAYIDNLPDGDVCYPSKEARLPVGLHYCGRYALGSDYFFSKYRIKKNILSCEQNLILEPPKDVHLRYDYFIAPPPADGKPKKEPEKKTFTMKEAKRQGFMVCGLIDAVNQALTHYKTHNCGTDANLNKVYTVKSDPGRY